MNRITFFATAVCFITASAMGQQQDARWIIDVLGPPVSPTNPTTTIRLTAQMPPETYALATTQCDLFADDGEWSSLRYLTIWSNRLGNINGSTVTDIFFFQFNLDPWPVPTIPNNPIALWEGVWSTTDFRPRSVDVVTSTSIFDIFLVPNVPQRESRLHVLTEGRGSIVIVPSPATATMLVFAAMMVRRRRALRAS